MVFQNHFAHPDHHRLQFRGDTGEYFKIWIVNVTLSIVTLGIYSAWAKVRRLRYFYGNTFLDAHSFDYHASPMAILKGRVLIVLLLVGYNLLLAVIPLAIFLTIAAIFAWPWIINRSLAFHARMTSYRSLRFDFAGSYGRAFLTYVIFPALAIISLGLLAPVAARARWTYLGQNLRYGGSQFDSRSTLGPFYMHLGCTIGFAVPLLFVVSLLQLALGFITKETGQAFGIAVLFYLSTGLIFTFWRTGVRNIGISSLSLANRLSFRTELSRTSFIWITATNLVLTIMTLGLMRPWAAIRSWRALTETTVIESLQPLDDFVSGASHQGNVAASEFADLQSVDLGF